MDSWYTCDYCGWHNCKHHSACPVALGDPRKMVVWQCGYEDGRAGKGYWSPDPTYRLGSGRGEVALETRENEYDPRH